MKYEIVYNRARDMYMVWAIGTSGANVVKTAKTKKSCESWLAKKGVSWTERA